MTYVALVIIVFFISLLVFVLALGKFLSSIFGKIGKVLSNIFSETSEGNNAKFKKSIPNVDDIMTQSPQYYGNYFEGIGIPEKTLKRLIEIEFPKKSLDSLNVKIDFSDLTHSLKDGLESCFDYLLNSAFFKRNYKKFISKIEELDEEIDRELYPEYYEKLERRAAEIDAQDLEDESVKQTE